ncbi:MULTISPECIES: hypothetical protein [unclassified Streptomyces]|uniref:hypothetical protein n=1 Tax=unclassified Streptomyces TaxID=2593676 RepID=UPI002DDC45C3|nr:MULTISPECIES: hypothetical protein [unclassified Streptomyces]WSA92519.1 hypothetical protein OIE63_13825 [Streptomyces sp. NBC_01795]WSB76886.1 hypothetical protein OHB04_14630 [Streptomyces sp. NBC_01775]WSS14841.1 hypothetical protein OG533_25315 [Streptomyces sp. NBC_01186]WSS43675.1 hypothetical protein OG220_26080 [Streptomyces sp. NBC_01187]
MTVTPQMPASHLDRALVEETAKKSGLVWVRGPEGRARGLWHVWHEGAVCLVGDGTLEQPLEGLGLRDGGSATVSVRGKDKGARLVAWPARVSELPPDSEAWQAAVAELKAKRLNAPDADTIAERWARECRVLRLEPAGEPLERPGAMPDGSHAATPPETPATTRHAAPAGLPRLLFRRRRK